MEQTDGLTDWGEKERKDDDQTCFCSLPFTKVKVTQLAARPISQTIATHSALEGGSGAGNCARAACCLAPRSSAHRRSRCLCGHGREEHVERGGDRHDGKMQMCCKQGSRTPLAKRPGGRWREEGADLTLVIATVTSLGPAGLPQMRTHGSRSNWNSMQSVSE